MNQPNKVQQSVPKDLGTVKLKMDSIMVEVNNTYTHLLNGFLQLEQQNKSLISENAKLKFQIQNYLVSNKQGSTLKELEDVTKLETVSLP